MKIGRTIAVFSMLLTSALSSHAAIPDDLQFHYRYNFCKVKTDMPIYKEGKGSVCGVANTIRYSDSSCPAARYESCRVPSNGVERWTDATATPGRRPDRRRDGAGDLDGCLAEGEAYIERANAGVGLPVLPSNERYYLKSVELDTHDLQSPLGGRIRASHICTYIYGYQRATYEYAPNSECGVLEYEECRIARTYHACRHESFGVESYEEAVRRDSGCGTSTAYTDFDLSNKDLIVGPDGRLKPDLIDRTVALYCQNVTNAALRFYCLKINEAALSNIPASAQVDEIKTAVSARGTDTYAEALMSGDARASFDRIFNKYLRDRSIAKQVSDSAASLRNATDTASALMSDDRYFAAAYQLAKEAMSLTPAEGQSASYEFLPLWSHLTDQSIGNRRPAFKNIADLKVLLAAADANTSPVLRVKAVMIAEYYVRLNAAYINKRGHDVLRMKALKARIGASAVETQKARLEASREVEGMNLSDGVRSAVLQQLAAAGDSGQLIAILDDLAKMARNEIQASRKDLQQFTRDLAYKDPLFTPAFAMAQLILGDYNNAILNMRLAEVNYRKLNEAALKASRADIHLQKFKVNFKSQIAASLKKAKAVFDGVKTATNANMDVLAMSGNDLELSFSLLELLTKFNLTVGDNLSGVRIQVLSHIETSIIQPLEAVSTQSL